MSTQTKTYEVVIEETITRVVEIQANNKGMAKIKAKHLAKTNQLWSWEASCAIAIKSCEEKELVQ